MKIKRTEERVLKDSVLSTSIQSTINLLQDTSNNQLSQYIDDDKILDFIDGKIFPNAENWGGCLYHLLNIKQLIDVR